ncbi:unnamed protein product [Victoria cruziana]
MRKKYLLRNLWGERAFRNCGKIIRLTLLSMVVYTIMKGRPIYESICMCSEKSHYTGPLNVTIHVVVGGSHPSDFTTRLTSCKDYDFGFVKLTAFNHSSLLFEYKKSSDGRVYDSFTINRAYRDVLACTIDSCLRTIMVSRFQLSDPSIFLLEY